MVSVLVTPRAFGMVAVSLTRTVCFSRPFWIATGSRPEAPAIEICPVGMILTLCSALDRYWPRPFTRASPCAVELPPPRQADDSVAASACSSCVLYPGCSWTSIDEYTLRLVPSALTLFRYVELSSFELILLEASGLRAAWLDLSLC